MPTTTRRNWLKAEAEAKRKADEGAPRVIRGMWKWFRKILKAFLIQSLKCKASSSVSSVGD